VLGEMLELGQHTAAEHTALGALAAELGIDVVVAVGPVSGAIASGTAGRATVVEVADADGALAAAGELVGSGDAVLVKASRAVGLERVAEVLSGGTTNR
ncbi:MAG TPA: UDP-N-acetylmuramoyl-tripeptide--D-alanyl-D-alanine ligase, partial [Acidimicrobiia bacterium]|nr:UDP-N-acetylmuramoyl-tripeptide--D-alanyl-D-alanine ligase [Acidimicrobiia bacterium]